MGVYGAISERCASFGDAPFFAGIHHVSLVSTRIKVRNMSKENTKKTEMKKSDPTTSRGWFARGLRNGIPICAGYFAVSFALGISAKNAGMDAVQAFAMSLTMVASAGQFAAINLIASSAGIIEMITTTLIVNLRYFLMSCSLTQKLSTKTKPGHRFLLAYCMTDEIFGLSATVNGDLNPFYTYGLMVVSVSGWCAGTVIGVLAGNILPVWVSNALGVSMYGMFLAIIIPPAKENHFIGVLVAISMCASWLFTVLPVLKEISSGFRIIILTLIIAGIAAVLRPVSDEEENVIPDETTAGGISGATSGFREEDSRDNRREDSRKVCREDSREIRTGDSRESSREENRL